LYNGRCLRVGDTFVLADKVGDAYKQTKFYDRTLPNPNWELFYPSDKDFNYIHFYSVDENKKTFDLGRVWRIFSNKRQMVQSITKDKKGNIIAYTEIFRVEIDLAIQAGEVFFDETAKLPIDFSYLKETFEDSLISLADLPYDVVARYTSLSSKSLELPWWKYNCNMNGEWYCINKNE